MPSLADAVRALDAGDLESLESMLRESPDLVRARVDTDDEPYAGYFHGATLLHHVAGNPIRCDLPANIALVAQRIIDHGAEVEATCGGGPTQPHSGGGTTLALVASSAPAAERGLAEGLIDVLVAAGADVNHLWISLYHTVECRQQRDVATMLHERGAMVDLCFAAALGRTDIARSFFLDDGTLGPGAYLGRYRPPNNRRDDPTDQQVLDEALVFACMNGRDRSIEMLLDRGAEINALVRIAEFQVTPLHGAAWAGWPVTARLLIERGADINRRDPVHNSAPPGWAVVGKAQPVLDVFREFESKYDLANSIEFGCVEQARRLLAGGDPDQPVGSGERGVLLRIAAWEGQLEMVRMLLDLGADPDLTNNQGRTALFYAEKYGRDDVARLLRGDREPAGS